MKKKNITPAFTKDMIIRKISKDCKVSHIDAYNMIHSFLNSILHAVLQGNIVTLRNFGMFKTRLVKKRGAKPYVTPPTLTLEFKASKAVNKALDPLLQPILEEWNSPEEKEKRKKKRETYLKRKERRRIISRILHYSDDSEEVSELLKNLSKGEI